MSHGGTTMFKMNHFIATDDIQFRDTVSMMVSRHTARKLHFGSIAGIPDFNVLHGKGPGLNIAYGYLKIPLNPPFSKGNMSFSSHFQRGTCEKLLRSTNEA